MTECNKEIHLAFPQGPCFGVKRSIEICEKLLKKHDAVYCIHPLVHNEVVMQDLQKQGLILEPHLENIPDNCWVILSAHGTSKDVVAELKNKGCHIVDAVCPLVLFVHKKAKETVISAGKVNIVGDPKHQEVVALLSDLPNDSYILAGENGKAIDPRFPTVFQSTTDPRVLQDLRNEGFSVVDTICFATKGRQKALDELIENCDALVVLGSSTSANTKHLAIKAQEAHKKVLLTLDLLQIEQFVQKISCVGIIAGASTPLYVVYDAYDRIVSAYEKICDYRSS
ncbi:hypothetical protein [Coprothermobacter platensis]|uniref:hypothetical protein n=1 Tax=Coprothermobacter platensis TaxID=108819 RepID=UPI00035FB352|nr:hypothetical protein [Coprothermobacter platensis]